MCLGYLITLLCFSLILILYLWRRGEIYPQEVIIHKFGVRWWEDEIQKRVRQGRHRWHVKIIKQINDRAWQTRGRETATATGGGLCKYATSYLLN